MELPSFLSKALYVNLQSIESLDSLQKLLRQNPSKAADFFIQACGDLMWVHAHEDFMSKLLIWLTDQFFKSELSTHKAKQIAAAIQENYDEFQGFLYPQFYLRVNEVDFPIQGLLFASTSDFFRTKAMEKYREDSQEIINIPESSSDYFVYIIEFIQYGKVNNLWKIDQSHLLEIIRLSNRWNLFQLKQECEERLTHYVDRNNLLEMLRFSRDKELFHLQSTCVKILNRFENDLQVTVEDHQLTFIFYRFWLRTLEIYDYLKDQIVRITCPGGLLGEPSFKLVVNSAPKLIGVDISLSPEFSENVYALPPRLQELNLSSCPWINGEHFEKLFKLCPLIRILKLNRDEQLNYRAWGFLQKLTRLAKLELAECIYLSDDELKIILNSCPRLEHLNLNGCTQLTRQAFFEMGSFLPGLRELHVKRCNLDDATLIELASHSKDLALLNISYNSQISDRGLLQVIKTCPALKTLDLTLSAISHEGVASLLKLKPELNIILRS